MDWTITYNWRVMVVVNPQWLTHPLAVALRSTLHFSVFQVLVLVWSDAQTQISNSLMAWMNEWVVSLSKVKSVNCPETHSSSQFFQLKRIQNSLSYMNVYALLKRFNLYCPEVSWQIASIRSDMLIFLLFLSPPEAVLHNLFKMTDLVGVF